MYPYFAYDPENGFKNFKTQEEAIAFANAAIDNYREDSADGWDELVEQVCWGDIKQMAKVKEPQPVAQECGCDYALSDLTPAVAVLEE
ncbi:hypothetical protein [Aeromonas veronii]|uniref:Uncharacterized protein n=1 Tax=Aeromonas veronii TaxID=654 RepID=A0A4S5CGX2_AERVE|nr:hypothetical protein [Aeromonas veronii]THJ45087.1 hypothetical protein E8Q35_12970 [Aeromonas veronii]